MGKGYKKHSKVFCFVYTLIVAFLAILKSRGLQLMDYVPEWANIFLVVIWWIPLLLYAGTLMGFIKDFVSRIRGEDVEFGGGLTTFLLVVIMFVIIAITGIGFK